MKNYIKIILAFLVVLAVGVLFLLYYKNLKSFPLTDTSGYNATNTLAGLENFSKKIGANIIPEENISFSFDTLVGMDYEKARGLILSAGANILPGACDGSGDSDCKKFPEIENCSYDNPRMCEMNFYAGKYCFLIVTTGGYDAEPILVDSISVEEKVCSDNSKKINQGVSINDSTKITTELKNLIPYELTDQLYTKARALLLANGWQPIPSSCQNGVSSEVCTKFPEIYYYSAIKNKESGMHFIKNQQCLNLTTVGGLPQQDNPVINAWSLTIGCKK